MQSERVTVRAGIAPGRDDPVADIAVWMQPLDLAARIFGDSLGLIRDILPAGHLFVLEDLGSEPSQEILRRVDVLITGWGISPLTAEELSTASRLRAVLHAGGQASSVLPIEAWTRGLAIGNAGMANAVPVAEYTVAMILLAGKAAFQAVDLYRSHRHRIDREVCFPHAGNYGQNVGIVGASRIGRLVVEQLRPHDFEVLVYDPYTSGAEIRALGAHPVALDALMAESDVVSLHPPANEETAGMISRELLASMKDAATIINTARGTVIDQPALVAELQSGRIRAVLDVTDPDVLPPSSPLYELPNVFLTPHIAGSMGRELRRIGRHVTGELGRISNGRPLQFPEFHPTSGP